VRCAAVADSWRYRSVGPTRFDDLTGATLRAVVIDKSGEWWTGTDAADLAEYLRAHQAGGYKVDDVVVAACGSCSDGDGFRVGFDPDEGFAERTCASCGIKKVLLDGAEIAADVTSQHLRCPCGGQTFDVAVGFARRKGDVRWVSVGIRCRKDGTLVPRRLEDRLQPFGTPA
jgi:hypothetical protein